MINRHVSRGGDTMSATSKSATNSPIIAPKPIISPSSISVTNSPRICRSQKYVQKILENEKVQEEARRLLMDGQQKLVIIPMGKSGANGKITPQVRVCSTSVANSSDSSDGKRTPPRRKRQQPTNNVGGGSGNISGKGYHHQHHHQSTIWKPSVQKTPRNSPSLRSLKAMNIEEKHEAGLLPPSPSLRSFTTYNDMPVSNTLRPLSDVVSVRSLVSIGMGSTDGKKLVIRRVPTSPSDLLNFAHASPGIGTEDDFSSCSSFSGTLSDIGVNYKPRRRYWSNKLQFILACVGYSIGLGNLWRFPYLCYKSGGGVFLIPYFLILLMCGLPLMYMELAVGQFTRRGPIGALSKLCPILKGAGISSVVVSFFLSTYYNVIIAYTLFYLFTAFRSDPPWDHCSNRWNTPNCWKKSFDTMNRTRPIVPKTPAEEFYAKKVLQISSGFQEFGIMRWELVACLFIVWVLVYFSLWKSVRSSGKVLYFTATVPFVLVLIFIGHSLSLEGASLGLQYLFYPKWELLLDSKVWVNAAAQNFNSMGIAFGSVISFASYNKYNNQIVHDAVAVSCINGITSLLVAVFAFTTIGNIAWDQGESIESVITDGPGLVFVVYPQALSQIPLAGFWSVLFFFTLLCIGLNSQFAIVEVVVTSVQDGFPNWIKRKLVCHEILVLVVCFVSFIVGLPNVFQGGIYFFQLIDHFVASISIMYIAFFEVIAIAWIYGSDRLSENIEKMTKHKPYFFFTYCWRIVTPLLLMCLLIFSLLDYESPTHDSIRYPLWAEVIGWMFVGLSLISVPTFAIYVILNTEGNTIIEKIWNSLKPKLDDYCSHHSDDSHNERKDVRELETLIEFKVVDNNNVDLKTTSTSTNHEQNA
ncbi:sodium- and chloride-dependent GABA transporter ine-like [Planococcus citri]|uniref:sodium- and chloride-dependent GABA transporter ine-like n=1 Tax=Planococcus citri TaxID=170843 RepID=UPI0031F91ACD